MENIASDLNFPVLKKGVKLPKSDAEWSTADSYFKFELRLNAPIRIEDLSSSITLMNDVVYNYFADNFGYVEKIPDKELVNKYKDQTVKALKKCLKQLKLSNAEPHEIKYVARTLRDKLRNACQINTTQNQNKTFNHDNYISRNFWGYVKNILNKIIRTLAYFHAFQCQNA